MDNHKIAAIVPALNEEKNIVNVINPLLSSGFFDEVIVVDDGSEDNTAKISRQAGVKVISLTQKGGSGKGNAMRAGVGSTDADIIAFFDADLVGLNSFHIASIINPVKTGKAEMCVGVRERFLGLPGLIAKTDPIFAIGGERTLKRSLFTALPDRFMRGFAVELAINYYCVIKKISVRYTILKKLKIIIKEKKWGLIRGLFSRAIEVWQIAKTRLTISFYKNEFI